jgi:GNAT superfamily N-acetyltransferase
MYEELGRERLKSGETLTIGLVMAPDEHFIESICHLLHHKSTPWYAHIESALAGEIDRLETRFYIGLLGGKPVGNVMTVEQYGIGILGHVFVEPEHRRKGICQAIMTYQMEHFRRRGGQVLLLGTGYESPPYWIYYRFGFRSLRGGFMRYGVEPAEVFERRWFAPSPTRIVVAEWRHWPLVALLASVPGSDYLRSLAWQVFGIGNLEGPYVDYMYRQKQSGGPKAVILETEHGAVVGCASLTAHAYWPNVFLLDVFTHANYTHRTTELIQALDLPSSLTVCYTDIDAKEKAAALEANGFVRETKLTGFLRAEDVPRDVWMFARG